MQRHRHVSMVGTGTDAARAEQFWVADRVLRAMSRGDSFFVRSTGRRDALLVPFECSCGEHALRLEGGRGARQLTRIRRCHVSHSSYVNEQPTETARVAGDPSGGGLAGVLTRARQLQFAVGVVMATRDVDAARAQELLLDRSRESGVDLVDLAAEVISSGMLA